MKTQTFRVLEQRSTVTLGELETPQDGQHVVMEWSNSHATVFKWDKDFHGLTVHHKRATKEQAIKTLAQRYQLAEREIVVFGDHAHDVSMLRAAHRGIAMENAIDAVKQVAHTVIGSHHVDSVLDFIERDWQGAGAQSKQA